MAPFDNVRLVCHCKYSSILYRFWVIKLPRWQQEQFSASVLHLFICLSVAIMQKLSNLQLLSLLATYRRSAILKIDMTSFFSAEGGPIWSKCRRLVQNDMSTAVMWWKSKPRAEFQYGGCLGEFNGMSSQSHVSIAGCCRVVNSLSRFQSHMPHCRVQSPGGINVMIVPHCRV